MLRWLGRHKTTTESTVDKDIDKNTDKENDKPSKTMVITFLLNQDNPQTITLNYRYLTGTFEANNIKPEIFDEEAKNIEKIIRKYHRSGCDMSCGGSQNYFPINFSLRQKNPGAEDTVFFKKAKDWITPDEALDFLHDLEKETKHILFPNQINTPRP